ncbi:ECF transporter S component [Alkaliphilus peptidifermentans]|uniref:Riboflavin transporter n=1 Tax=Alkaliphilus peptidifermentans DSM 18978 TaxID=1120976 RepID=A0A1G5IE04_9FIRM|nr:ECF transporter S component [Alkaliphilus peptidifermentans]SCY74233.1 Riboflavin transporter FmnP [Alkaliphilus peptidifermentans DSM 18978]
MQKAIGYGRSKKRLTTVTLVKISILSVIAFLLMMLEFPIPLFPNFLKVDLSDVPALIGGFAIGPVAGVIIQLIKVFLFFITRTDTGGVGELANFIIGASYVLPAALIYHIKKDKKHAVMGAITGTLSMCFFGALANLYILIPFYSNFMPIDVIVEMGTVVNSNIVDVPSLVLYAITPFNFIKGSIITLVTLMIYKKISPILKNR